MAKISVEHLKYMYPMTDKLVLNDISFQVEAGEIVGIVGTNGCLLYTSYGLDPYDAETTGSHKGNHCGHHRVSQATEHSCNCFHDTAQEIGEHKDCHSDHAILNICCFMCIQG